MKPYPISAHIARKFAFLQSFFAHFFTFFLPSKSEKSTANSTKKGAYLDDKNAKSCDKFSLVCHKKAHCLTQERALFDTRTRTFPNSQVIHFKALKRFSAVMNKLMNKLMNNSRQATEVDLVSKSNFLNFGFCLPAFFGKKLLGGIS